mmetsp:Transcript_43154/g.136452  ORF Transcript_43154/g.136452 Transcript_43154/m.136452 type:complete len:85 (+) Transcript_43154:754-1008(+)
MEFSTCHPSGTEEANASIIFTFTESVFAESVNQLTLAIDSFVAQSTDKELCAESALAGQHHYKGTLFRIVGQLGLTTLRNIRGI